MLGGERGASVGVAVSFPCAFSRNGKVGIRGQVFWNWGNIWNSQNRRNWVSEVKNVLETGLQSYGFGVMIPFMGMGHLEVNYYISRKRFGFLFSTNWSVCWNE